MSRNFIDYLTNEKLQIIVMGQQTGVAYVDLTPLLRGDLMGSFDVMVNLIYCL